MALSENKAPRVFRVPLDPWARPVREATSAHLGRRVPKDRQVHLVCPVIGALKDPSESVVHRARWAPRVRQARRESVAKRATADRSESAG